MKKLIIRGGIVVVLLVVVAAVALYFSLNGIVKNVVQSQGTSATGVATTLDSVNLNPFAGAMSLNQFELANPEGFSNPSLFKLGEADVKVQLGSLTSDEIVVDQVYVDGAEVVVSFENGKLNLKELLKQIEENAGPAQDAPAEDEPAEEGAGKSVLIKDLKITNTKVRGELSLIPGMPPVALDFVIADIEEKDFREADTGAVIGYVIETIMINATTEVFKQVEGLGDLVGGLGDLGGKAIEDLSQGAGEALDGAGQEVGKALDGAGKALDGLLGGNKEEDAE